MSWYRTGTIAATNGSKIITGAGTQFLNPLNGVSAGRMLLLPGAGTVQIYEIASVQSNTQLTLVDNYTGTTGAGKLYAIPTSPTVSIEQFAHDFAETLAYYQQQLAGWQAILTGTGDVTLTTPDGQSVTVRSQRAWDTALNGKMDNISLPLSRDNGGSGSTDGAVRNAPNAPSSRTLNDWLSSLDGNMAGSAPISNDGGSWHTYLNVKHRSGIGDGINYGFVLEDRSMTSANYDVISVRKQVGGSWLAPVTLWHSGNLTKQSSVSDTTIGAVLTNGSWGLGGIAISSANYATIASTPRSQFIGSVSNNTGFPTSDVAWTGIHVPFNVDGSATVALAILAAPSLGAARMQVHTRRSSINNGWLNVLMSNQYTVDANGFYKSASPILRLANSISDMPDNYLDGFEPSGCGAVNIEAVGANAERLAVGIYRVTGALGLSVEGWTIEIPQDVNGNRLVHVATETADNGDITVYVSKRKFDIETGNIVAGEPMDIPAGRWIDLRLSMPLIEAPTPEEE
ncbi:hypothetical protein Bresa_01110|uniref:Phage tail protein C-terminal domain-containing protein n=3 Tax=Enterobacterales TaxID=91347 RepID=A0A366I958_9GAMM|nr:hypothetical protein [Brenneria salicis ATCC 15712 = DSM 30166]RBP66482.1 hypothetical protein DES54_1039 [Brenneria salicis ATCC 15712 = DSM 30166]